jgi:hypothetical protein
MTYNAESKIASAPVGNVFDSAEAVNLYWRLQQFADSAESKKVLVGEQRILSDTETVEESLLLLPRHSHPSQVNQTPDVVDVST